MCAGFAAPYEQVLISLLINPLMPHRRVYYAYLRQLYDADARFFAVDEDAEKLHRQVTFSFREVSVTFADLITSSNTSQQEELTVGYGSHSNKVRREIWKERAISETASCRRTGTARAYFASRRYASIMLRAMCRNI